MSNALISSIVIGSDTYDIKDAKARADIAALEAYTDYLGVTTTALTDGAQTNPVTIGGESVTAKKGNIVNYGAKEFIFNGTAWQEFGDLSALGGLAYTDSAAGDYTPQGTVSQPVFEGSALTSTGTFTPQGTVSQPAFEGSALTSTGTFTPSGTVTGTLSGEVLTLAFAGTQGSLSVSGTPAGTVSQPTFEGTAGSVSVSGTPAGTVSQPTFSGTPAEIVVGAAD